MASRLGFRGAQSGNRTHDLRITSWFRAGGTVTFALISGSGLTVCANLRVPLTGRRRTFRQSPVMRRRATGGWNPRLPA
jgi:hypothetical protein